MTASEKAATKVIDRLMARSGFDALWDSIDMDVHVDILKETAEIIEAYSPRYEAVELPCTHHVPCASPCQELLYRRAN